MRQINYLQYDVQRQQTLLVSSVPEMIQQKPLKVLESWANACGTGIEGSRQAFKHTQAGRQKLPVLVDPYRQVYFFPTQSPKWSSCLWINASQILSVKAEDLGTRITFRDGSALRLPIGQRSIKRQLTRIDTMRTRILTMVLADGALASRTP